MGKTMGRTPTLVTTWVVVDDDGDRVHTGVDFGAALAARRKHGGVILREDVDASPMSWR